MIYRAIIHDFSKFGPTETPLFAKLTPKLKHLTYGSPEYEEARKQLGIAVDHHYEKNSHHPEHYPDGINGMSFEDLVEMWMDWKAAVRRHNDGCVLNSISKNKERFNISDQLADIMRNSI